MNSYFGQTTPKKSVKNFYKKGPLQFLPNRSQSPLCFFIKNVPFNVFYKKYIKGMCPLHLLLKKQTLCKILVLASKPLTSFCSTYQKYVFWINIYDKETFSKVLGNHHLGQKTVRQFLVFYYSNSFDQISVKNGSAFIDVPQLLKSCQNNIKK